MTSSAWSTSTSSSSHQVTWPSPWDCPGQANHPSVQNAIDDALRRIKSSGHVSGTLTTPRTLDHYVELGVLFLYVGLQSILEPASHDFIQQAARGL